MESYVKNKLLIVMMKKRWFYETRKLMAWIVKWGKRKLGFLRFLCRDWLIQLLELASLKSIGQAGKLETQAGIDVPVLRQNFFSIKTSVLYFYRIFFKDIKENPSKWEDILCSWIGRLNIVKCPYHPEWYKDSMKSI